MAGERKRCYEDPKNKGKKPDQRDGMGGRAGMFIAYLFLERQWMLFTIDFAILLSCLLGISDPEEARKSTNLYWIFLITRVMDVAIRLM